MLQQTSVLTCHVWRQAIELAPLAPKDDSTLVALFNAPHAPCGRRSGGGRQWCCDVSERDRRCLAGEGRIQRCIEEPPDAGCRNRADQPCQLELGRAVD